MVWKHALISYKIEIFGSMHYLISFVVIRMHMLVKKRNHLSKTPNLLYYYFDFYSILQQAGASSAYVFETLTCELSTCEIDHPGSALESL